MGVIRTIQGNSNCFVEQPEAASTVREVVRLV